MKYCEQEFDKSRVNGLVAAVEAPDSERPKVLRDLCARGFVFDIERPKGHKTLFAVVMSRNDVTVAEYVIFSRKRHSGVWAADEIRGGVADALCHTFDRIAEAGEALMARKARDVALAETLDAGSEEMETLMM